MEFSLIAVKPGDLEKENHSMIEEKGLIKNFSCVCVRGMVL